MMSKEISKAKTEAPSSSSDKQKQYVKRSELEAARLEEYNAEQERIKRERQERAERKRKLEEEDAERNRQREEKRLRLAEESRRKREAEFETQERERRKRLGLPELPSGSSSTDGTPIPEDERIGEAELVDKLRELGEPIRLFGESYKGRLKRYRRLIERSTAPQQRLSDGPIPTTLTLLPESEMKVPDTLPKDEEGKKYLFRQLASYFTMIMREWEAALAKRGNSVKQSFQGRQAYNAMVQSKENMKPLFRKFENGDLEEGILDPVVEIVRHAQERRYVDANDGYLRLSIGKA